MHLKALQDTGRVSLTWDSPARTVGLASEHAACMSDSESHGFFQESSCISHCVDFIKGISQEDPQKKSGLKPVVLIIFLVF